MTRVTVRIDGVKNAAAAFRTLGEEMAGRALDAAVEAGALHIENRAKDNVTTGGESGLNVRSGTLRRSIDHQAAEKTSTRVVYEVGTNLVYGPIHEYGGLIRARNGPYLVFQVEGRWVRTREVYIPARPYLRPAFDAESDAVIDEIRRSLDEAIRHAAAKGRAA